MSLSAEEVRVRGPLERDLPGRVARYLDVERCARYVVERGLIELRVRSTMTGTAERQVKRLERDVVNRYVRRALLAGGWPGHIEELVDRHLRKDDVDPPAEEAQVVELPRRPPGPPNLPDLDPPAAA